MVSDTQWWIPVRLGTMATAAASGPHQSIISQQVPVSQEEGKDLTSFITSVYTLLQRAGTDY